MSKVSNKPHSRVGDAESILEAIEVGSSHDDDSRSRTEDDLERVATGVDGKEHAPATRTVTAQDWNGPDDPDNPLNWTFLKKALHFWPTAILAFSVTVGSSLISSASQDSQTYFDISRTAAIVPLTVYVIGLGLGPMIAAPLSETFGRSSVYKVTAPVYILFLVGAGLSKTFASLVTCRLVAGMAGAPVVAVGAGTNVDLFDAEDRALSTSLFIMMPFLGPAFGGPHIGGFAAQFRGWQWTVWCNIIIAGLAMLTCLPMQETYKKVILQRRAKKLNLPLSPGPKMSSLAYWKVLVTTTLTRPLHMPVLEPIVLFLAVYNAFAFCIIFVSSQHFHVNTFGTVYGFNTWQTGLAFMALLVGVLLAAMTAMLCDKLVYQKLHGEALAKGKLAVPPEHRLYAGMMGAIGMPIGLLWFAWTASSDVHWISPILAGIPFAWGNLALFISSSMYAIDEYGPLNGASAMAANGLLRYVLGGCFPLWTVQMYKALGITWATSLLAFICVTLRPIPFVFFKFGPAIRRKSHYDTIRE